MERMDMPKRNIKLLISFLLLVLIVPVQARHVRDAFATGDATLTPNPIPSSCSSNCPPVLVAGPTFGSAIVFSVNTSITGRYKILLGPNPFNVTIADNGRCIANQTDETSIPLNSFGSITPLKVNNGYVYCLYYSRLPAAKTYSLEVTYKHPGDMNFIQTITWAIP